MHKDKKSKLQILKQVTYQAYVTFPPHYSSKICN